jgi:hypothetical protein
MHECFINWDGFKHGVNRSTVWRITEFLIRQNDVILNLFQDLT